MPTVANDADLYQKINALLDQHGAGAPLRAAIDALFHGPEEPKAAERDPRLPADAPANAVVFDTTGKTYADFKAFFDKVGFVPIYDQNGNKLDVRGQPIQPDGGASAPNLDPFAGAVEVLLQNVDSTAQVSGIAPAPRVYQVVVGEQYDQKMQVVQNGVDLIHSPFQRFSLSPGPVAINCEFNPAAVTPEIIASREAAGQGVSRQHYQFQRIS